MALGSSFSRMPTPKHNPYQILSSKPPKKPSAPEIPHPSPANHSTTVTRRSNLPVPRHAGVTARVDDGPPHVDLTRTYYNAGYGTGVLCSVHSSSPSCQSVLDAFCSIDPSLSPNSNSIDLFASRVTLLSTHVRFTYSNNSQYRIDLPARLWKKFRAVFDAGSYCHGGIRGGA
jgi:hypothetical protein